MGTKIEINDILDANAHNSAMALTVAWSKVFKKYAMEDYEELSDDPASSFNVFTHLTAQGAAKAMYEQQARINETNESTAILPKSLLNKLTSEELTGIFGKPSSTTIAFAIKKQEIIDYSIPDSDDNVSRLVINKNMTVTFESHPAFTLPYDVVINCKPIYTTEVDQDTGESTTKTDYNIYAYYDMPDHSNDGMRDVFNINNQYISSREMRFEGTTYIAFFLKVFQITRKEITFYISDPYTSDTTIGFDNLLVGAEVFRTEVGTHKEVLMTGYVEGISLGQNSYNYSYDYKRNAQNYNIIFSKLRDNTALKVGDNIRAIIYTTQGSIGNIEFPYMIYNVNSLAINYSQNLQEANQNAMLNIICVAFARDTASIGGQDSLTFEEIRQKIINKNYSRNILVTNNEIINKGKEVGLSVNRIEQDLIAMYYTAYDSIIYKDMVLSTGTSSFYFDLTKKNRLLSGYNYYMIEPTDVFSFDKTKNRFVYKPDYNENDPDNTTIPYLDYVGIYNKATDIESITEVSFPFYMRYENTSNPKIQIYDMFINATELLSFTDYKEVYALDKLDIAFLRIQRNPFRGSLTGTFDKNQKNTYYVSFICYVGTNTLNKLYMQSHSNNAYGNYVNSPTLDLYKKQYITFKISMTGVNDNTKYNLDPTRVLITNADTMLEDGYVAYQATFETNNFISDDKQIQLKGVSKNTSISYDYSVYVPVDTTVKFSIEGTFNDSENNPNNNSCITYETDSVILVDYKTDDFKIDFDIETVIPGYETYENNIEYKYEMDKYIKNDDYNPAIEVLTHPNHYEYEVETDENDKVIFLIEDNQSIPLYKYAHKIGDVVFEYKELSEEELAAGPSEFKDYYIESGKIDSDNIPIYTEVEHLEKFEDNVKYFTASTKIKHYTGDIKYYLKGTDTLLDEPTNVAINNVNVEARALSTSYIGICKNVPWINRLYMAGETMYEKIVNCYQDISDRMTTVKNYMFDGAKIFIGLNTTSGKSNKFQAFKLANNSTEYINNIALSFEFRVKYYTSESLEYKEQQIIAATTKYIKNIGDSDLSVDNLFDAIRTEVPDIEYINILRINTYTNGEVQTILNDTSVTNEVLTISQKLVVDETGDIDFVPDITVYTVN